jgi:hypothetical protein
MLLPGAATDRASVETAPVQNEARPKQNTAGQLQPGTQRKSRLMGRHPPAAGRMQQQQKQQKQKQKQQ